MQDHAVPPVDRCCSNSNHNIRRLWHGIFVVSQYNPLHFSEFLQMICAHSCRSRSYPYTYAGAYKFIS
jgi:hypothetical protein